MSVVDFELDVANCLMECRCNIYIERNRIDRHLILHELRSKLAVCGYNRRIGYLRIVNFDIEMYLTVVLKIRVKRVVRLRECQRRKIAVLLQCRLLGERMIPVPCRGGSTTYAVVNRLRRLSLRLRYQLQIHRIERFAFFRLEHIVFIVYIVVSLE